MEKLINIRLYGKLGARFGRVHRLAVRSPVEAVKALSVNIDGFEDFLVNAKKHGMVFAVFRGKKNIAPEDIAAAGGDKDIRIAPVIEGAKKAGLFQTVLGAVIIAAGVLAGPLGAAFITSSAAWQIGIAGAGLALGGVMQLLSPQPTGLRTRQDADNRPSYAFGGAVNTTVMGNPVAVLYGEREIGGAIISAGVLAEDI